MNSDKFHMFPICYILQEFPDVGTSVSSDTSAVPEGREAAADDWLTAGNAALSSQRSQFSGGTYNRYY